MLLSTLGVASSAAAEASCESVVLKVPARHWVWVKATRKVHGHRVVVRRHGKILYRHVYARYLKSEHEPVCAPAPASAPPAAGVTAAASLITLHAHLDASFAQSPANPLQVTYSYSASATEESAGVASQISELPSGVLNLYSEGLLACSINVGGSITGGACTVTYAATGTHTVVVSYISGVSSATETDVEQIGPLGTVTTLSVIGPFGCGSNVVASTVSEWCDYTVAGSATGETGASLGALRSGSAFAITASTNHSSVAIGNEYGTPIELRAEVRRSGTEATSGLTSEPHDQYHGSLLASVPGAASWSVVARYAGSPGWAPSQSSPGTLSP